ncbi:MAG: NAD(P)H-binding protein [Verrucomicrobia bacterium]|nr:NAD(P)H-binding protein [Verrucomicrobiota bacterium]
MQVLKEENYTPMKYLITGATGNIGALVVERLLGWGHRPRVFVRDTAKARALHGPCVDISVGDLADAESIATALR